MNNLLKKSAIILSGLFFTLYGQSVTDPNPAQPTIETWDQPNDDMNNNPFANEKYDPSNFTVTMVDVSAGIFPMLDSYDGNTETIPATDICKHFAVIYYNADPAYFAKVYCLPKLTSSALTKPIPQSTFLDKPAVFGDPFDPINTRHPFQILTDPNFQNIFLLRAPQGKSWQSLREKGYSFYFLDFAQGGGDLRITSAIELKFIQWLEQQTSAGIVLCGASQSGIVARMALLYSLPENNTQLADLAANVKGFLTVDSPHQGASISVDIQEYLLLNNRGGGIWPYNILSFLLLGSFDIVSGRQPTSLNVPSAHQMLYAHMYDNNSLAHYTTPSSDIYDRTFGPQGWIKRKGNYRFDMPKVALACSNTYLPHSADQSFVRSEYQPTPKVIGCQIIVPGVSLDLTSANISAGGSVDDPEKTFYELEPGCTGDWFYRTFYNDTTQYVSPNTYGGEKFKGTFMPFYSVLDLNPGTKYLSMSDADLANNSPFDKVLRMNAQTNGYPNGTSPDNYRYQHIIFDDQMMQNINSGVDYIEQTTPAQALQRSKDKGQYQSAMASKNVTLQSADLSNSTLNIEAGAIRVEPEFRVRAGSEFKLISR
jgi:hypothetical protein